MAADHLVADRGNHVAECEAALFFRHPRVEDHLQQQVAEFILQRMQVIAIDGIDDFIRLLDRVWGNRGEGLLDIPGTAAIRVAQARHDRQQGVDIAVVGRQVVHRCFVFCWLLSPL